MARLVGVDIPDERRVDFGLTKIYGVSWKTAGAVLEKAGIAADRRVSSLTGEELAKLAKTLEGYTIEGDLRRQIAANIERLKAIGSYRGKRHVAGLPARGQRTRTNARTRRGHKRMTVGALKKEEMAKVEGPEKAKAEGEKE